MRQIICILLVFYISFFSCLLRIMNSHCNADEIIIAADHWCPINCDSSGPEPGVMVEIAQKSFKNSGHTVTYKVVPWARAVADARRGKINGIVGAFVGDAPDFIFPDNELLMISSSSFFTRKDSNWFYDDIASLSNIQLGAIKGYDYGETMNTYIKKGKNVQLVGGGSPLEKNIKKLVTGRIDVIIEAEPIFWYTAGKMKLKDRLKAAGKLTEPEKCYIAFSPSIATSEVYAKILSDGVDRLRKSGELNTILNKYGFQDWK